MTASWNTAWNAAPPRRSAAHACHRRVRRRAGKVGAPAWSPPTAATAGPPTGRDQHAAGVRTVAIPRQATTSAARKAVEHGRGFFRLVKWRTGREGRISYLKHRYGWDRTRLGRRTGAAIWCGHGYSPITWSRSGPSPADPGCLAPAPPRPKSWPFPDSDFQVEVI
jgi:hypothetical protein